MIDMTTKKPLKLMKSEGAPPILPLPWKQVPEVRALLDAHNFRYSVDDLVVSVDGGPQRAMIYFGERTDAAKVQAVLDSVL